MAKRNRSPGKVRTKFHHTKPTIPKPLSKIVPQRQLQTPSSHPESSFLESVKPWGLPPPDKYMSEPEWAIYWALIQLVGEENFFWRYPVQFTRYTFGQYTPFVDFLIPHSNLVILMNYETDQIAFGQYALQHDQLLRVNLESMGMNVVMIDADDADQDPIYFVSEALQDRDHSRWFKGV